jgi:hypothetical protein
MRATAMNARSARSCVNSRMPPSGTADNHRRYDVRAERPVLNRGKKAGTRCI